jgi:hypothetical protein
VTPKVSELLSGKVPSAGFPHAAADVLMTSYLNGWMINVSERSSKNAEIEKLEGMDEVWAICCRKPKPGWRIFGRFFQAGTFIAFDAHDRYELASRANYSSHALKTVGHWDSMFPREQPYNATSLDQYLTGMVRNVDESE